MIWNTLLLALRERSGATCCAPSSRSWAFVIGVAAVITMVTLGNGATKSISDQVSSLGSNLLMVRPGQRIGPGGSAGAPLFKIADVQAITAQVTGEGGRAGDAQGGLGGGRFAQLVHHRHRRHPRLFHRGRLDAHFRTDLHRSGGARGKAVCVIGSTIVRELFGGGDPGEMMRVADFSCQVIGVLASKGQSAFGSDQDDVVIMPIRTVQRRLTGDQDVRTILVSAADGVSTDTVKERVEKLLRERRKIGDNEDDNFNVLDTKQIAEALSTTTRVMTTCSVRSPR